MVGVLYTKIPLRKAIMNAKILFITLIPTFDKISILIVQMNQPISAAITAIGGYVPEDKATSDMAVPAVLELCRKRGIDPSEIDCLIVATVTPDMVFPATANIVCDKIGAINAWGYDMSAACSGFLFALTTGASYIESGRYKKVVVVGADKMSAIIDYSDRNTCILFGDGAGAILLEPN